MMQSRILLSLSLFLVLCLVTWGCAQVKTVTAPESPAPQKEKVQVDKGRIYRVAWDEDGHSLIFMKEGKKFRFDLTARTLETVTPDPAKEEAPKGREDASRKEDEEKGRKIKRPGRGRQYMTERSPDGQWYAVCRDWNVVLENDETGETIQVTREGHRKFRYGTANWVYGEEIDVRHGMWWSPDSRKLVFYEFDERPVIDFYLTGDLAAYNTSLLTEGYMKAGAPNPVVSLLIYDLAARSITPVDTGAEDQYLFNMRFTPDGTELLYNRADRRQQRLDVMALDLESAATRVVVTERQDTWQDNQPTMRFLADGKRFIWATEKSGWRQYELRHLDGSLLCAFTRGDYPVVRLEWVDEERGWIYYTARSDTHPLCTQLHRVRLNGTDQHRLTPGSLNYSSFSFSSDGKWFTARYENLETPPSTSLFTTAGEEVHVLAQGPKEGNHLSELFTFKAEDGITDLYGILYKPEDFDPRKKYPLVVSVYGGPGSRSVRNTFQDGHPNTRYGCLIARIDNRGTGGRGKAFKGAVYEKLGDVDIRDQADGVRHLLQRPYLDPDRVGIVGHSYGGFMAAMGILRHPHVFKAAAVCSAVTDWRQYDSIYTERYMNLPQDNPEGYDAGSVMPYAANFEGKMLIMHGMMDDNVHPNNAWQLIQALDEAKKPYESRFFPSRGHGTGGNETIWDFFSMHIIDSLLVP